MLKKQIGIGDYASLLNDNLGSMSAAFALVGLMIGVTLLIGAKNYADKHPRFQGQDGHTLGRMSWRLFVGAGMVGISILSLIPPATVAGAF